MTQERLIESARATLERVRKLRVDYGSFVIEVTSVEDSKGRGWREPTARVENGYAPGDLRLTASDAAKLADALPHVFEAFKGEFGKAKPEQALPEAVTQFQQAYENAPRPVEENLKEARRLAKRSVQSHGDLRVTPDWAVAIEKLCDAVEALRAGRK